jgi:polysaccharide deacetylase family protein (PEP-CTERM system associated)
MNRASPQNTTSGVVNAMTIDVEDYFQVSAFAPYIAREGWEQRECRVERNMDLILGMLAQRGIRATFFTLGWLAQRYPQVVRAIVAGGHELASHGYGHERASDLDRDAFRQDLVRAKALLEDTGGVPVLGYRAPSFSIGQRNLWAFDVLQETGHRYSSSVYPIAHDHYGMPEAPRFAFTLPNGLLEVPATTLRLADRNLPCSGGGYFRLMPYALSRWMIGRVNREGQPAVFYFHPWEVDPAQPRIEGIDAKTRFRHYVNLSRNTAKLGRLFGDFRWGRMDEIFLNPQAAGQAHAPVLALAA